MTDESRTKPKLRYRWSHRRLAHRTMVRWANWVLLRIPLPVKYAVTDVVRRKKPPYHLLGPGSVAIQIGAPRDTLLAGRSRAMTFARRTRPNGRVLVVEPDSDSVEELRRTLRRHGLRHVDVVCAAAWSEPTLLEIMVDARHPATNVTAGCVDYSDAEMARFRKLAVEAVTVDDLLATYGFDRVDLVSITTNGAETEILRGLRHSLERHRPDVSLARTNNAGLLMRNLGYEVLEEDDRGRTFRYQGIQLGGAL